MEFAGAVFVEELRSEWIYPGSSQLDGKMRAGKPPFSDDLSFASSHGWRIGFLGCSKELAMECANAASIESLCR
jgi:hypothetical protein